MAASNAQKTAALVKQGGLEEIEKGKHAQKCQLYVFCLCVVFVLDKAGKS